MTSSHPRRFSSRALQAKETGSIFPKVGASFTYWMHRKKVRVAGAQGREGRALEVRGWSSQRQGIGEL